MPQDLRNKVIFITGASSGIGAATAVACAAAGMHVTLAARRKDKLETVAQRCRDAGGHGVKVCWVACDVGDDNSVRQAFEASWAEHGRLDVVFANAGYGLSKTVLETSLAEHQAIFDINYLGTVRTLQAAAEQMDRTPHSLGHYVICSSCLSDLGLPGSGVYSATKAAQKSIAQAMRAELAGAAGGKRRFVTSVHPVTTRTEFFDISRQKARGSHDARTLEAIANPHERFAQDASSVARKIVRAIRTRKAEVWGMMWVRWGMAIMAAFPGISAWAMRRVYEKESAAKTPR